MKTTQKPSNESVNEYWDDEINEFSNRIDEYDKHNATRLQIEQVNSIKSSIDVTNDILGYILLALIALIVITLLK